MGICFSNQDNVVDPVNTETRKIVGGGKKLEIPTEKSSKLEIGNGKFQPTELVLINEDEETEGEDTEYHETKGELERNMAKKVEEVSYESLESFITVDRKIESVPRLRFETFEEKIVSRARSSEIKSFSVFPPSILVSFSDSTCHIVDWVWDEKKLIRCRSKINDLKKFDDDHFLICCDDSVVYSYSIRTTKLIKRFEFMKFIEVKQVVKILKISKKDQFVCLCRKTKRDEMGFTVQGELDWIMLLLSYSTTEILKTFPDCHEYSERSEFILSKNYCNCFYITKDNGIDLFEEEEYEKVVKSFEVRRGITVKKVTVFEDKDNNEYLLVLANKGTISSQLLVYNSMSGDCVQKIRLEQLGFYVTCLCFRQESEEEEDSWLFITGDTKGVVQVIGYHHIHNSPQQQNLQIHHQRNEGFVTQFRFLRWFSKKVHQSEITKIQVINNMDKTTGVVDGKEKDSVLALTSGRDGSCKLIRFSNILSKSSSSSFCTVLEEKKFLEKYVSKRVEFLKESLFGSVEDQVQSDLFGLKLRGEENWIVCCRCFLYYSMKKRKKKRKRKY